MKICTALDCNIGDIVEFVKNEDSRNDCEQDELRFIFTLPTFVAEKTPKEHREFYMLHLKREKSLYGREFEVRLRDELKQKIVVKECAEWMRRKAHFKRELNDRLFCRNRGTQANAEGDILQALAVDKDVERKIYI